MSRTYQIMVNGPVSTLDVEIILKKAMGFQFSDNTTSDMSDAERVAEVPGAYLCFLEPRPEDDEPNPLLQNIQVELWVDSFGLTNLYPYREDWLKELALLCGWHIAQKCLAPVIVMADLSSVVRVYNHPNS